MENGKQLTAVEWMIGYINHLNENGYDFHPKYDENIVKQAKAMEKEQIVKAHTNGWNKGLENNFISSQEYYNENYKSE